MLVRRAMAIVAALMLFGIAAVFVVAARKPDHYQIVRRVQIAASPETIFQLVGDLSQWEQWSPWKYRDPMLINRLEGAKIGTGSRLIWTSSKSGSGQFEVTAYEPPTMLRYRLSLSEWDVVSEGEIRIFGSQPGHAEVSWKIEGKNSLSNKLLWTVFGMEKAMAADLDLGLSILKAKCEAGLSAVQGSH